MFEISHHKYTEGLFCVFSHLCPRWKISYWLDEDRVWLCYSWGIFPVCGGNARLPCVSPLKKHFETSEIWLLCFAAFILTGYVRKCHLTTPNPGFSSTRSKTDFIPQGSTTCIYSSVLFYFYISPNRSLRVLHMLSPPWSDRRFFLIFSTDSLRESCSSGSGVPPWPAIPTLSTHLLEAAALRGNYYSGDKRGDKPALACMMHEVSGQCERCTWPGNEW